MRNEARFCDKRSNLLTFYDPFSVYDLMKSLDVGTVCWGKEEGRDCVCVGGKEEGKREGMEGKGEREGKEKREEVARFCVCGKEEGRESKRGRRKGGNIKVTYKVLAGLRDAMRWGVLAGVRPWVFVLAEGYRGRRRAKHLLGLPHHALHVNICPENDTWMRTRWILEADEWRKCVCVY